MAYEKILSPSEPTYDSIYNQLDRKEARYLFIIGHAAMYHHYKHKCTVAFVTENINNLQEVQKHPFSEEEVEDALELYYKASLGTSRGFKITEDNRAVINYCIGL